MTEGQKDGQAENSMPSKTTSCGVYDDYFPRRSRIIVKGLILQAPICALCYNMLVLP